MKTILTFAIPFSLLMAAGCATTNEPTEKDAPSVTLTGDDLRAVVDKTFEGRTSDGYNIRVYNSRDGKLSATSRAGSKTYSNTGVREIKGNEVCNRWDNPDWKPGCWTAVRRGDVYYYTPTTPGAPSSQGKFLDGNPYNL